MDRSLLYARNAENKKSGTDCSDSGIPKSPGPTFLREIVLVKGIGGGSGQYRKAESSVLLQVKGLSGMESPLKTRLRWTISYSFSRNRYFNCRNSIFSGQFPVSISGFKIYSGFSFFSIQLFSRYSSYNHLN